MKYNSLRFLFAFAALVSWSAAFASGAQDENDHSGNLPVDVVVDMTEAGKKVERPTPEKPAYYLPLPTGYKDWGYAPYYQGGRPTAAEVEAFIETEFAKQGYQVMTKGSHPSLVLSYLWGYIAPVTEYGSTGPDMIPPGYLHELIYGDTMIDGYIHDGKATDFRMQDNLKAMEAHSHYYVIVSAFDFQDWLHHKTTLLWRAHISTPLWGHHFDQVLSTLIATAAPMLGRETTRPQVIPARIVPMGHVILGTPVVKDYPAAQSVVGADKKP